jgi:hypothetical protein
LRSRHLRTSSSSCTKGTALLRVLKNSFRLNALWLLGLLLLLMLLEAMQAFVPGNGAFSGLIAGAGFGNLMIVAIFARQSHYGGDLLHRTLPVDSSTVVAGYYFMIAILCLGLAAFGSIFRDLLDLVTRTPVNYYPPHLDYPRVHSLIVRVISWWMVVAIAVPFMIRYGSVLRIVVGYLVVGALHSIAVFPLLRVSVKGALLLGLNGWIAFVMTLLVIACILSFMISVEVFRRKEF